MFLQSAAAAAASFGFPAIVPSRVLGANAPSNRVTIATIGVGAMGKYHLRAYMAEPACRVIALCDCDGSKLEEGRDITKLGASDCTRDFRELLARPDLDAVEIATPEHWHTAIAIAAMKAGKSVYLQKPVSLNIAEGRALADTTRRLGAVLQTGSQQRSSRDFRFACELVRNGHLGKIRKIEVGLEKSYFPFPGLEPVCLPSPDFDYDMWLGPAPWKPYTPQRTVHFRGSFDYSGGYFADWGAHHLDIVQWALGMDGSGPVLADGRGTFLSEGIFDVPMEFAVRYEYADGTPVVAGDSLPNGIRFEGTKGWVFVSREKLEAQPRSLLSVRPGPGDVRLRESNGHIQDFLACVKSGREPIVPAEVGHRSATICHLGNISMRLGRPLRWDPAREEFVNDPEANRMRSGAMRAPWRLA